MDYINYILHNIHTCTHTQRKSTGLSEFNLNNQRFHIYDFLILGLKLHEIYFNHSQHTANMIHDMILSKCVSRAYDD